MPYPESKNKVRTFRSLFHVLGKIDMIIFEELDTPVAFVKMEFLIYFKNLPSIENTRRERTVLSPGRFPVKVSKKKLDTPLFQSKHVK